MDELEIFLKKEIGADLGSRQQIERLFKNIDCNISKLIINFEGVEFIGRSFAQEYLNQKQFASFEIIEKNMNEDVEKMFQMILKLNNKL